MMNSVMMSAFTLLIVAPAISICDEDLSKVNIHGKSEQSRDQTDSYESVTTHPLYAGNDGTDYTNENVVNNPWVFYRQLRAPSGFFGVRGKKDFEPGFYWDQNDAYLSQPKRAPSQAFFGMRGKKYYDNKRAPSGFYGMRGKKSNYGQSDDDQAELYRDLQEERARIASFLEDYIDEKEKRKPSGFVGLRGKKSVNNDDYYDFEKRASMGFQGVRGKKSEYSNFIGTDDKRMPVAGFFGMRGKKQPLSYQSSSSFFGVRKKPYLPYGKFVGVRGKKAYDDDLSPSGLRAAPRVASDTSQDKIIGFIGMRG